MTSEWAGLADDAKSERRHKGPVCAIARLYASLSASDRKQVEAVINNPNIPAAPLRRALAKRLGDETPGQHTITRHRRNECGCGGSS